MTRFVFWLLIAAAAAGCACGEDDSTGAGPAADDDIVTDDDLGDNDTADDDLIDDDAADDDAIDDDAVDDDAIDDDLIDDDAIDDDVVDDDTADDDVMDDDIIDDDSIDDDAVDDDTVVEYEYDIKVDNMAMADIIPVLPLLAERGMVLYLNVRPYDIGADLLALLTAADEQNVRVKLWPLLTSQDGSWGCEDDLDLFMSNVLATIEFVNTIPNSIDTIVLNMELSHPKIDLIWQYFDEGNYWGIIQILWDNRDLELFAQNQAKLQGLLDNLHGMGYAVQVTTYPFIQDDFPDGDPDIQDICNLPLEGLNWDVWASTPYRTDYENTVGLPLGPYLVYSYGLSAVENFGAQRAAIALGFVEPDIGYISVEDFAADIAAAKAAGVRNIDVYHLPGIMAQDDPEAWLDAMIDTPPAVPDTNATVDLLRAAARLADGMVDYWP